MAKHVFEAGDLVRCVRACKDVTVAKTYEVISNESARFCIMDDVGDRHWFNTGCLPPYFELALIDMQPARATRSDCWRHIGRIDFIKSRLSDSELDCKNAIVELLTETQQLIERLAPPYNAEGD